MINILQRYGKAAPEGVEDRAASTARMNARPDTIRSCTTGTQGHSG
jgi:hypothetical protein